MWPSAQGPVPSMPQNLRVYANADPQNQQVLLPSALAALNSRAIPEIQNQLTSYTTYVPSLLQGNRGNLTRLPHDMSGGMVLADQNRPFENRIWREGMPLSEYLMGEVVMVKCNQHKWLYGVIQKMSAHGVRIWISDAELLVNVPMALLPTHVIKLSTNSEPQNFPQSRPMLTMATIDSDGCRRVQLQCVRPAHLSHRQLYRLKGCLMCVLCKTPLSRETNMVNPWHCPHRVHTHCLQLHMQHSSTLICPSNSCNTSPLVPPLPTSFPRDWQEHEQWSDPQNASGLRGQLTNAANPNVLLFCPNCNQPINVNQMMIDMPINQQLPYMEPLNAYSHSEEGILRRAHEQNQMHGGPVHSISSFSRLEAIEEGQEGPPSLESVDLVMNYEEPGFFQFGGVPIQNRSHSKVIDLNRNTKLPSTSQKLWSEATLNASVPSRASQSLNDQLRDNDSGALEVVIRPAASVHINHANLAGNEEEVASPDINSPDAVVDKRTYSEEFDAGQTIESEFWWDSTLYCARESDKRIMETNSSNDLASRVSPNTSAVLVNRFPEFLEVDESLETLDTDKVTVEAKKEASRGKRLWRRASEVALAKRIIDVPLEASSSMTDNAAPPVYVNHFADFVKLAMADASTAKDILATASAASTPSNTYADASFPPNSDPPHPTPAPFTPRSIDLVTPAATSMSPGPSLIRRAPGFFAEPAPWLSVNSNLEEGANSAWITVIKDGKDARSADAARWELSRLAKAKEVEFG